MNKVYASLLIGVSTLTIRFSYAQNHSSDVFLKEFNSGLLAKEPEMKLSALAVFYAKSVDNQKVQDSLFDKIVKIYPLGSTAATRDIKKLDNKALSGNLKLADLDELKAKYPNIKFNISDMTVGNSYAQLIEKGFPAFLEEDSTAAVALIPQLSPNGLNMVARSYAEKSKHLSMAAELSQTAIGRIKAQIAHTEAIPLERRSKILSTLNANYASYTDTYALILSQLGKKKEALTYETEAVGLTNTKPEINTRYISLLIGNGENKKALAEGSEMYSKGLGNDDMLKQIAIAYRKENKGKSVNAYIKTLNANRMAFEKADIGKSMINKPSPNFTLKNMKGENVTLSDYKGKVVVLDFWAMWCVPCKQSFPGMQLALNKYKNNPDVVFLFIDTWETTEPNVTKTVVEKFMTERKYTFNVLFDIKINEKESKVVSAYTPFGITSIPVKFFVGKDNQVKFMEKGFAGSSEKVLDNVVEKVDFLLKENM